MTTPHKHAALIHAWADGAEIEFLDHETWVCTSPSWNQTHQYRIKPTPRLSDEARELITLTMAQSARHRAALETYILSLEQKVQP